MIQRGERRKPHVPHLALNIAKDRHVGLSFAIVVYRFLFSLKIKHSAGVVVLLVVVNAVVVRNLKAVCHEIGTSV